jgi:photosystem II stability/assembly factor-like uncharacterized protein
MEPWEDAFAMKEYPLSTPSYNAIEKGYNKAKLQSQMGQRTQGKWQIEGPGNIGARVNSIAIHPTNENIIFAGYSDGGLWKSIDGGANWKSVFDNEVILAIGHIAFDPSNPNRVYVGTGDPNISAYPRAGGGIYVSDNMGESWKYIGLVSSRIISKIIINKNNSNIVYASTMGTPFIKDIHRGVYKSTDKGATWSQVLHINDSTGVSDLIVDPNNPEKFYALGWNRIRNNYRSLVGGPDCKIYKTSDGGGTWKTIENGLPNGPYSRLGFAVAPSNSSVLYAQYTSRTSFELEAIYKSSDEGQSWIKIASPGENGMPNAPLGGFGWYFGKMRVNPTDENDLFLLGVGLHRYVGSSWRSLDVNNANISVHADKHDLIIRNNNLYLATDGGLYKTNLNNIANWQDIENIPTTQVYRTAYDPHRPNTYWLGAQDNGTCSGNGAAINSWQRVWGGDGFQMQFHPTDKNIMLATSQNGALVISRDGGNAFRDAGAGLNNNRHWDMHYIFGKHSPTRLYTGTDMMYEGVISSTEVKWTAISGNLMQGNPNAYRKQITHVDQSPLSPGILYCGTTEGSVWGAQNKNDWQRISGGLPDRYVSSVKASPNIKDNVYVSYTGYRDNEEIAYIYKSTNLGTSWKSISSNLPKVAINDILVLEKYMDRVIFVATDAGIYMTVNGGDSWDRLGDNMPFIPVFDIDYDIANNKIIGGTFARGIMTFDLNQISLTEPTSVKETFVNTIKVWPTTTQSEINLEINHPYIIYDALGKQMHSGKEVELDVSSYPQGTYYVSSLEGIARFIVVK